MATNPQVSIASGATAHSTIAIPAETSSSTSSVQSQHTHSSTSQSASVASFTKVTSTTSTTTTTTNGDIQTPVDAPEANPHFRPPPNTEEEYEGNQRNRTEKQRGDKAFRVDHLGGCLKFGYDHTLPLFALINVQRF